jgi:2-oxoglutarate ferredoxin oxidoreductase subunit beta
VREHNMAVNRLDFLTGRAPITADYAPGTVEVIEQHDGSKLVLRKVAPNYDPHDRVKAMTYLQQSHAAGEIVTGLLYVDKEPTDLHAALNTVKAPLNTLNAKELCPGSDALAKFNASLR